MALPFPCFFSSRAKSFWPFGLAIHHDFPEWHRFAAPLCDYHDIEGAGEVGAGIRHEPEGDPEIVVYVEVEDVDRAVERAKGLGASVRIPPMEYGNLRFALIEDPEGNPIGLTREAGGRSLR